MPAPPVGARLTRDLYLDAAAVSEGASAVGDRNPLHHDAEFAARSRYGGLIASGAYTAALLAGAVSGLIVDHGYGPAVGMDYAVRFRLAVPVGRLMRMEWVVAALHPAHNGTVGHLEGRIVDAEDGRIAMTAEMRVLFFAETI